MIEISPLERRVARVLGAAEPVTAYLLRAARAGHLCVAEGESLTPDPAQFWPEGVDLTPLRGELQTGELVREGNRLYLPRYFAAEKRVVAALEPLLEAPPPLGALEVGELSPQQAKALDVLERSRLLLLCGGPGTGKTFTAGQLVRAFRAAGGGRVALAAPTGKAASNLERALEGEERVQTLHRLLRFRRGEEARRLGADLLIVDEASMIDVEMLAALLESLKEGARLVLMGDPDQLPPVEVGALFGELVQQPHLQPCVVRLDHSHRTDRRGLLALAAAVREGRIEESLELLREVGWSAEPTWKAGVPVLTPVREGPWGVKAINTLLHARFGGEAVPIMILRNDVATGLYNGDTGVLKGNRAHFGAREFPVAALPPYQMAYCISVHKSQGSEFDSVCCLFPEGSQRFGRQLLYTAITRAKEELTVVGSEEILRAILTRPATYPAAAIGPVRR